ncbi:MAG: glycosyltransferase family 4 protein [Candidatus Pacearchaeota archaeon]|jgi:glycosyltransferase involved in cell wall biosynthesis
MKVYIQRPWKFADSPYYQYLLNFPPKGIEYIGQNSKSGVVVKKSKFKILHKSKNLIRLFFRIFNLPIPNAHLTRTNEKYDLIHCAHCLSLNKKPWICDTEWVGQFWVAANFDKHPKKYLVKKILKNENCKKILAWTKWSYDGIVKEFPEIKNKIEVIYPGIPTQKLKKIKTGKINLLFVSRRFYFKGGLHALEVIDRLTKKYKDVNGIFISDIPRDILEKYSKNKKITFYDVMPQKKLFEEIYPTTDIFVYPSYTDTFGFPITEAMSFGIPVVSVDGHSRKEIIEDGKTGFVIQNPNLKNTKELENLKTLNKTIDEIEKKVEILIKNKKLRERMSKNSLKEIEFGKFSIKERDKKLIKIYKEAL